mmetsp:Transcript_11875/g.14741  ORF Transcript_11875/g.14741 Transcript_11875/m.14741 type:complete len:1161 (+) Transcript_11875:53-3535(+)
MPPNKGTNGFGGGEDDTITSLVARPTEKERLRQYKTGSILRVKLKNFLTYAAVEFRPGPRLNVVIGPNGTGKSTILCAICLGLGGQPPLLGRADDARTFIKNDEEIAEIEIELSPPSNTSTNTDVIRRVIDRNKGAERGRGVAASTYFVNGVTTNLKTVQKLVSEKYKIAIDNLCTFLPQDRVGSFSAFDSKQLLQETEKSVSGTQHLYDLHQELIESEKDILESDTNLQTMEDKVVKLNEEVGRLEREKKMMEERKLYLDQKHLLEQKQAWLKFDNSREEALNLKQQKKEIKVQLAKAKKDEGPVKEQISSLDQDLSRNEQRRLALQTAANTTFRHYSSAHTKAEKYQDQIEDLQVNLTEIDTIHRRALLKVDECRSKLEQHEAVLSDYPPERELTDAHQAAHAEQKKLRDELKIRKQGLMRVQQVHKEKSSELDHEKRNLARMQDEKARRNEAILHGDEDLRKVHEFINQNRKMFRRPVYGPIVCEITTQDKETSNCLEQHVRNAVLKSFVVECIEDSRLLYREVRQKQNLAVNIQVVEQGKLREVSRKYSDRRMDVLKNQHGVRGYLDEFFNAPDAVMQALMNTSNVQSVLIGSERTTESLNNKGLMEFLNQKENGQGLRSSCIYAKDGRKIFKYTSIISRYSGKASLSVDEISNARMLRPGVPPEEKVKLQNLVAELQREIDDLHPQLKEKEVEYNEVQAAGQGAHAKMKDAQRAKQELNDAKSKVAAAKRKLQSAEKEAATDNVAEKRRVRKNMMQSIEKYLSTLELASANHDEYLKSSFELSGIAMTEEGKRQKIANLHERIEDMQKQTRHLEIEYSRVSDQFNKVKYNLGKLKEEAIRIAPIEDENGNDLPLKEKLSELPDSAVEIEEAIDDADEKISSIHENPHAMKKYEEQKKELETLRGHLDNLNQSKEMKRNDLQAKRAPWEAALVKIVEDVSKLFSQYMKELGCAGEVRLGKGDTPSRARGVSTEDGSDAVEHLGNFKEWGVEILVKFREKSELQVLSAQVHSGGERSVSTIMYLMAMQSMMVSPFRCVDEINQGLDERNERLVFRRIVDNSTMPPENKNDPSSHCGQYFLITPKLLPNLTDMENENVTVHCIFNGPYNFKNFGDWDVDTYLDSKRTLTRELRHGDGEENRTPDISDSRKKQKTADHS